MMVAVLVVGVILLALILQDAFEAMLLPRRVTRRWRIMAVFFQVTWPAWRLFARAVRQGPRRERFLSIFGPLSMTLLFMIWATGCILAFGLIQWALQHLAGFNPGRGDLIYMSGVTFFTLGYGDVTPHGDWARRLRDKLREEG